MRKPPCGFKFPYKLTNSNLRIRLLVNKLFPSLPGSEGTHSIYSTSPVDSLGLKALAQLRSVTLYKNQFRKMFRMSSIWPIALLSLFLVTFQAMAYVEEQFDEDKPVAHVVRIMLLTDFLK